MPPHHHHCIRVPPNHAQMPKRAMQAAPKRVIRYIFILSLRPAAPLPRSSRLLSSARKVIKALYSSMPPVMALSDPVTHSAVTDSESYDDAIPMPIHVPTGTVSAKIADMRNFERSVAASRSSAMYDPRAIPCRGNRHRSDGVVGGG